MEIPQDSALLLEVADFINPLSLGGAGRFVYYSKEMNAFVLAVQGKGWDNVGEIADKALELLKASPLWGQMQAQGIGFIVEPLFGKRMGRKVIR